MGKLVICTKASSSWSHTNIPQHRLATIQRRKQSRAMGLVVWTERVGSNADIPSSITPQSVMHLLPDLFDDILNWGADAFWRRYRCEAVSVIMQPLCCSQCVVQWCSQTPKHVLLKMYDCTYCLLFYNHVRHLLWCHMEILLLMWIFICLFFWLTCTFIGNLFSNLEFFLFFSILFCCCFCRDE